MKLRKLSPNLMVNNVDQSVAFYTDVLGFQLVLRVPDEGSMVWAMVQSGDVTIMLQARESFLSETPMPGDEKVGGSLSLYVEVEGLNSLFEGIGQKIKVVKAPHETFYGTREFMIQDPNGYFIVFAENVVAEVAV